MTQDVRRMRGRPRTLKQTPANAGVQALDRGLQLLRLIAQEDGLTLTELAELSGLAVSSVHRILLTLEQRKFVAHDEQRGVWLIGIDAFTIGTAFLRYRRLATMGRATLRALMENTGETACLGIEENGETVYIAQIECHGALRAFFRAGTRSAMHASGIGKALLAAFPEARMRQIVHRQGLERFTERTIIDVADLRSELDLVRQRGWATDDEERTAGMRCVAAAIYNEFGEAIAAVSISGPSVRVTKAKLEDFGPIVRAAAAEITGSIGGRAPSER